MAPCRHGHIDGALHRPCWQCKAELAESENDKARDVLARLIEAEKHKLKNGEDDHYKSEREWILMRALLIKHRMDYDDVPPNTQVQP